MEGSKEFLQAVRLNNIQKAKEIHYYFIRTSSINMIM